MKHKLGKLFVSALFALLLISAFAGCKKPKPVVVDPAALEIDWYDEDGAEFHITTKEQLYDMARLSYFYDFFGQTFYLDNDIVFNEGNASDWKDNVPEYGWESIYGFAGTFDGQGYTIRGLYSRGELYFANIERVEGLNYITSALFRDTDPQCVVRNLRLENCYLESDLDSGAGSISSNGGGTFENIYSNAIIRSQKSRVGGIIGTISGDCTIRNCWFDGSIDVVEDYGRYIGGIAARTQGRAYVEIEHCLVTADISCETKTFANQLGGILGQSYQSTVLINDCFYDGKITGHNIIGSVIGNVAPESETTVTDTYTCLDSCASTIGYIENGILIGKPLAFGRNQMTGIGGYQWTTLDFENWWICVEGSTPRLKYYSNGALDIAGVEKKLDMSWYDPDEDEFHIRNLAEFIGFTVIGNQTGFEGKTVYLDADLIINEGDAENWDENPPELELSMIGSRSLPFAGTFDGQGHTISGFYMNTDASYSGLFGCTVQSAVLKNFRLENSYFETTSTGLGSIVGHAVGTIDSVYSNAIVVSSSATVGGFIGRATDSPVDTLTMNNCWFDGKVINKTNNMRNYGGFIGWVVTKASLTNCLFSGTLDVSGYDVPNADSDGGPSHCQPYAGGFAGWISPGYSVSLTDCFSAGEILFNKEKVTSTAGSVFGYSSGFSEMQNTYATEESSTFTIRGNVTGSPIIYPEADITGYGGYEWLGLDFDEYWAVKMDDTPILKAFADEIPSLDGIERRMDTSWYDEDSAVYVLTDLADLRGFALLSLSKDFSGKTVKLGNNITMNAGKATDWQANPPKEKWAGIGTTASRFNGTFDGQGFTVSGLYMSAASTGAGFFNATGDAAVIRNFRIRNSYLTSTADQLGSVAGSARGSFSHIYSSALIDGKGNAVGGFLGATGGDRTVTVSDCQYAGTAVISGRASYLGGMIGRAIKPVTVRNSLVTGQISHNVAVSTSGTSCFIGYAEADVTLQDCVTHSNPLYAGGTAVGFFVGRKGGSVTLTNCHAINYPKWLVNNSNDGYPTCSRQNTIDVAGVKSLSTPKVSELFTSSTAKGHWVASKDSLPVLSAFAGLYAGGTIGIDTSWYKEDQDEFVLTDLADLYGFALLAQKNTFEGKTVKLGADITVNTDPSNPVFGWAPIGGSASKFAGTFDGQGHTVSGIVSNATTQLSGFFGDAAGAAVRNFKLVNSKFTYGGTHPLAFMGGLAGRISGTIEAVYVDAVIESKGAYAGGFVGCSGGELTILDSWNAGPVTGETNCYGGFVGNCVSAVTLKNCLNTGHISTSYADPEAEEAYLLSIGGFFGRSQNGCGLYNCLNLGRINFTKTEKSGGAALIVGNIAGSTAFSGLATLAQDGVNDYNSANSVNVSRVSSVEDMKGIRAIACMPKLFLAAREDGTLESHWNILVNDAPRLAVFDDSSESERFIVDYSWYDPTQTAYTLSKPSEFYGLSMISNNVTDFEGKTILLGNDIAFNKGFAAADGWDQSKDADGTAISDGTALPWTVIGSVALPFNGTFDGQGHTVSGIYLDTNTGYQGMFAATGDSAVIRDFKLKNSYFTTTSASIGSIVGNAKGTFEKIYSEAFVRSTGTVPAGNDKGGVVGGLLGSTSTQGTVTMKDCWFAGSVRITGQASYMGGLIGRAANTATNIENCLNTGELYHTWSGALSTAGVGGLVGFGASKVTLTITDSVNHSEPQYTSGSVVGLIVGRKDTTATINLTNCHSILYKYHEGANLSLIHAVDNSVYPTCTRQNRADVAGLKSYSAAKVMNLFSAESAKGHWVCSSDSLPVLTAFAEEYAAGTLNVDTSWYDEAASEFTLTEIGQFFGFAILSQTKTFAGKTVKLGADMTIAETDPDWPGIGASASKFEGTFDGQGHTISGIRQTGAAQLKGLFGDVRGAQIRSFRLVNSEIAFTGTHAMAFAGGIAGRVYGGTNGTVLENIYTEASVYGKGRYVGGLVGMNDSGKLNIRNCWNAGEIRGERTEVSGFVGYTAGILTIENCLNTGSVSTTGTGTPVGIGGFVGIGHNNSPIVIRTSLNTGLITTTAANGYGLIAGSINGSGATFKNLAAVASAGAGAYNTNQNTPNCLIVTADEITGDAALTKIPAFFDEKNGEGEPYWITAEGGTPILKTFAASANH